MRNAIDHGIETKEQRSDTVKPPKGTIKISAYHEGNNLIIQVKDDGKGIDPRIIESKAIEKGVIKSNHSLTEKQLKELIFHPGFSTKEKLSDVSGRGVGMDVVKTNIVSLNGSVNLDSELGSGSVFTIRLPLTLAIIDGLVTKIEEQKYIVPLSQVSEIVPFHTNSLKTFTNGAHLYKVRDEVLPLYYLNRKLGLKSIETTQSAVLIVKDTQRFAVAVDEILNQRQIVVKNLGQDVRNAKGIMGSAIMPDGLPSIIFDLVKLYSDEMKVKASA